MKSRKMKAFSLIELIVVMAIMAILVLVAGPKYLNYTKEAREKQIIADVKLANNKLAEYLFKHNDKLPNGSSEIDLDVLRSLINEYKVHGINGIIKSVDETNTYYIIPEKYIKKETGSKLEGQFFASNGGDVYYINSNLSETEEIARLPIIQLTAATDPNETIAVITYPKESIGQQYRIDDGQWIDAIVQTGKSNNPLVIHISASEDNYIIKINISNESTVYARATFPGNKIYDNASSYTKPKFNLSTLELTSQLALSIDYSTDISFKEYRLGNGEWLTYNDSIIVEYNTSVYARGKDINGNIIAYNSINITNIKNDWLDTVKAKVYQSVKVLSNSEINHVITPQIIVFGEVPINKNISVSINGLTTQVEYLDDTVREYSASVKLDTNRVNEIIIKCENVEKKSLIQVNEPKGIYFDGINDYAHIPNQIYLNFSTSQDFTFEYWVKISSNQNTTYTSHSIIEKWSGTGTGGYPYVFRYNGTLTYAARYNSSASKNVGINNTIFDKWFHVAYVKQGTLLKLYINGEQVDTNTDVTGTVTNTSNIFLARRGDSKQPQYFRGSIADIRIWNKALSDSEIIYTMDNESSSSDVGLVGYWKMNDGSGTVIKDYSIKGNNGVLYEGTWN